MLDDNRKVAQSSALAQSTYESSLSQRKALFDNSNYLRCGRPNKVSLYRIVRRTSLTESTDLSLKFYSRFARWKRYSLWWHFITYCSNADNESWGYFPRKWKLATVDLLFLYHAYLCYFETNRGLASVYDPTRLRFTKWKSCCVYLLICLRYFNTIRFRPTNS